MGYFFRMMMLLLLIAPTLGMAERLKELADLQGVRSNPLIGYGLIVGLDGSGDQVTQAPFVMQSVVSMLANMGVKLPAEGTMQLKNVAAVIVTAQLSAYARVGQQFDVTVSSVANAKSLKGGTLLMTPLKGADGQIYGIAQGNVFVGGAGEQSGGAKTQVNHLSVGRVMGGGVVEREIPTLLGQGEFIHYELHNTDFGTAQRVAETINRRVSQDVAQPLDGRSIRVRAPLNADERVAFLAQIENIDIRLLPSPAKVIINARSGSIVMTQSVVVEECAVAHGNLSITISAKPVISQPGPLSQGQTVVTQQTDIDMKQDGGSLMRVKSGTSLAEVVRALNALGANPMELVSILQAMKAAGALRAELEII